MSGSPLVLSNVDVSDGQAANNAALPHGVTKTPVFGLLSYGVDIAGVRFTSPLAYLQFNQAHFKWLHLAAGVAEAKYYLCSSIGKIRTCDIYKPKV